MKVHAVCLLLLIALQRCNGSTLRASSVDNDKEDQQERELQSVTNTNLYSSPLNYFDDPSRPYSEFHSHVLAPLPDTYHYHWPHKFSVRYSKVFRYVSDGDVDLTCDKLLALFSPLFVEESGEIFTVVDDDFQSFVGYPENPIKHGLYLVESMHGHFSGYNNGCLLHFSLLYEDDNIGRIVPSTGQFGNIRIIAVDKVTNKIYGYYFDHCDSSTHDWTTVCGNAFQVWDRKATAWGDAIDGSLVTNPTNNGDSSLTSGISKNGKLFNLWGSFSNFNYARQSAVQCLDRPAIIDDWSGDHAGKRGIYCPGADTNNQLKKYTYHSSGSTIEDLSWVPAARIGRPSPDSNIYGVSTDGTFLHLWYKRSENVVKVAGLDLLGDMKIRSIGAGEPGYARGFFVSDDDNHIYHIYWESEWKMRNMGSISMDPYDTSIFFGYYNDKAYVLESKYEFCAPPTCYGGPKLSQIISRYDFVGGSDRYDKTTLGQFHCGGFSAWSCPY